LEQSVILEAEDRVRRMELCFDLLRNTADPETIHGDPFLREQLSELIQYYEGGQWLRDYTLDEQGYLSTQLKRGVLSQDAVFDFLERINPKPLRADGTGKNT